MGNKIKEVIREKKNGEDESHKINEINIELLIAEWGRINVCGM